MKALGKVFLLLVFVGVIVLIAWKAIDSTLFAEEENAVPAVAQLEQAPSTIEEPKALTQDQAFESTTDDTPVPTEAKLTCLAVNKVIAKLYEMRTSHKDYEQAVDFIQSDDSVPASQADAFVKFAHQLWDKPIDKLEPLATFLEEFNTQCKQLAK